MRNERGVTFLELLLVLTILGVLTIIVIPVSNGWTTVQSERDAFQAFRATIQRMQAHSIANRTVTVLEFSEDGTAYTVIYSAPSEKTITLFPPTVKLDPSSSLKTIGFQDNGNMLKTGTLAFETASGGKKLKFQFQRGRMLFDE